MNLAPSLRLKSHVISMLKLFFFKKKKNKANLCRHVKKCVTQYIWAWSVSNQNFSAQRKKSRRSVKLYEAQILAGRSSAVGTQIANKTKSQDLQPYFLTATFCSTFPEDWDLLFIVFLLKWNSERGKRTHHLLKITY